MKQQDITMIAVVVIIAAVFSFVISSLVFSSPKKRQEKVPVVQKITADFANTKEDVRYQAFFNTNALNPTVLIQVSGNQNAAPIGSATAQ